MREKIEKIKRDYKLKYIGSLGTFRHPLALEVHRENIFLIDVDTDSSQLFIVSKEDGSILKKFDFEKKVIRFAYSPDDDCVIFNYNWKPGLSRLDLKTGKISQFNKIDMTDVWVASIKIMNNRVYTIDSFAHHLKVYNLNGNLENVISLGEKFAFPIGFCPVPGQDKILLTRYESSFAELFPSLYNKYKPVDFVPGTNFGCYDIANDSMKYLPGIETKYGEFLWHISCDMNGRFFINNNSTLFKFNSSFEMLFTLNLQKFIFGTEKGIAHFESSSIKGNTLYIVERDLYNTIFKLLI